MALPRRPSLLILFVLLFSTFSAAVADEISRISPTSYVTDLAGVIPAATRGRLESLCSELQHKTGAQLAIVTINSLDDRPVEDYAVDLFKHLGVGAKKDNSGILLLLAPSDRKYRIEVGYGLEPIINDARAGDAGRAMVPFLRQNDYGSAVEIAAWQLAKYIADDKGATLSVQTPVRRVANAPSERGSPFALLLGLLIFIFFFSQVFRAASLAGRGAGCSSGCLWLLPFLLSSGGGRYRGGGSDWGGGGFGGGGSSGGGGGDFGGFGGGSSGGGGASGSW